MTTVESATVSAWPPALETGLRFVLEIVREVEDGVNTLALCMAAGSLSAPSTVRLLRFICAICNGEELAQQVAIRGDWKEVQMRYSRYCRD